MVEFVDIITIVFSSLLLVCYLYDNMFNFT